MIIRAGLNILVEQNQQSVNRAVIYVLYEAIYVPARHSHYLKT